MQEESKNNLISESTREMLDKAAEELAWLFVASVEQKLSKKKVKKEYEKQNVKNN